MVSHRNVAQLAGCGEGASHPRAKTPGQAFNDTMGYNVQCAPKAAHQTTSQCNELNSSTCGLASSVGVATVSHSYTRMLHKQVQASHHIPSTSPSSIQASRELLVGSLTRYACGSLECCWNSSRRISAGLDCLEELGGLSFFGACTCCAT